MYFTYGYDPWYRPRKWNIIHILRIYRREKDTSFAKSSLSCCCWRLNRLKRFEEVDEEKKKKTDSHSRDGFRCRWLWSPLETQQKREVQYKNDSILAYSFNFRVWSGCSSCKSFYYLPIEIIHIIDWSSMINEMLWSLQQKASNTIGKWANSWQSYPTAIE